MSHSSGKSIAMVLGGLVVLGGLIVLALFLYISHAFPAVRPQGTHLAVPGKYADCVTCHAKVSAQVAQDWNESKHGVTLVKCVVCHGEPDGKGSIPFTATPDPRLICSRCHDPALSLMVAKYGEKANCSTCHPYHQNPMHGKAYEIRRPTTQTTLEGTAGAPLSGL